MKLLALIALLLALVVPATAQAAGWKKVRSGE